MLQGSIVSCQLSNDSQQETEDKRQLLKSQLRLAWSGEAVKQGVVHAKKAEYDTALGCYKKVTPYTHLPWALDISLLSILYCPHPALKVYSVMQHLCLPADCAWCNACTFKLFLLVIFFYHKGVTQSLHFYTLCCMASCCCLKQLLQ